MSCVFRLEGKRAVITGGGSGIGAAIAKLFAENGASVVALDLNPQQASAAAEKGVVSVRCDVSDAQSVESVFNEIASAGAVNILVNCAGVAHVGRLDDTAPEDMDRLYRINVRGTYLAMRAAMPLMKAAGGGSIVNMASIAATAGLDDRFAYSMTKGAVRAMTFSVAKDYIQDGIRCNCISPARVHTGFVDGFLAKNYPGQEAEKMKELASAQPIGRMGTPEEIAQLALYLCSDAAAFVTGADYLIDGGWMNLR